MSQRIEWKESAKRDLRAIEKETAQRILIAITRLVFLNEGDIKKLEDMEPPEWRLRVGDYRVRYRKDGELFTILAVANRREANRR